MTLDEFMAELAKTKGEWELWTGGVLRHKCSGECPVTHIANKVPGYDEAVSSYQIFPYAVDRLEMDRDDAEDITLAADAELDANDEDDEESGPDLSGLREWLLAAVGIEAAKE